MVTKYQKIMNVTCLSAILLDSFIKIDSYYYPQIFLKECKCAVKKKKIITVISEELNLHKYMNQLMIIRHMNLMNFKIIFQMIF